MAYRTRRNVARAISERGAGDRVFRVLALDGGGMRGLIPAQVLAYLDSIKNSNRRGTQFPRSLQRAGP